ncbi:pyridoxal phosphate-dependent aminotransferase [Peptostreptococcus russellii]|uniref:pyridoxal phosphate-dependent aminotransferase n=1 Tax=Peptostreptococcus russellii TaxID=215200 RepID=UPI00162343F7|nr:pyridoxal phosphate-dependent aminotransferase [Peptostreptococcus russellii]
MGKLYGMSKMVEELVKKDYLDQLSNSSYEIDCSVGENPYGLCPEIRLDEEIINLVSTYPDSSDKFIRSIVSKYSEIANLSDKNIALTTGSIGALTCLNRLFLKKGKKIIGIAPQFTAVIDDFNLYGADYDPVYLKEENNYKFEIKDFLNKLESIEEAYIYIDNPNNPTGQVIPLDEIEKIVMIAKKNNSFVCIDEAYGDYFTLDNSAINILNKYDNIAVVRTLSKGLGGAGIRAGYLISNEGFIKYFKKVNTPFGTSVFTNEIAAQLLESDWEEYARRKSIRNKRILIESLNKIKVAETAMDIPIAMYYVEDDSIDLEKELLKNGVRVVSGSSYDGLSKNHVRINLHRDFDKMLELIKYTDLSLEKTAKV